ncbi:MAG TPA: hypothetical protein ENI87_01925 [bacterium]|nr:hypothetical protein [bacterium]
MSLTGKLILGFLFALVLQVAQMVVNGYVTAEMQQTAQQVSDALQANIAVQRSTEVVRTLRGRIAADQSEPRRAELDVYAVFADEIMAQAQSLSESVGRYELECVPAVVRQASAVTEELHAASEVFGREEASGTELHDALEFVDDALDSMAQELSRAQVVIGELGEEGVASERSVRDLPWRAGILITLCGVVLMAAFVAWFSRQLVIPIERAWAQLERRVEERTAELATTVEALEGQIRERIRAEREKEEMHRRLLDASRQAGMAELANGVLHNVGNVLNSVNVSTNLLLDHIRQSRVDGVGKAVALLREHGDDLAAFLQETAQGKKLPAYLDKLGEHLVAERDELLREASDLIAGVQHMKEIVHRQQAYASVSGALSVAHLSELIDDVLKMHATSLARHEIEVVKDVSWDEAFELDRSRVMQILMNLVKNAKQAIGASDAGGGRIEIGVAAIDGDRVQVRVRDTGVGIAADDLARIFGHGFTTKRDGHGFGLHHSANSASEMGGRLWAESDGPGTGATFVLELPVQVPAEAGT